MSDIKSWSPTAANNNAASPDGFKTGMKPKDVGTSAREVMAAVRRQHESAEWIDLGAVPGYASATSFTVTAALDSPYVRGRRVKITDSLGNIYYGTIISTSGGSPTLTVTVTIDGGTALPNPLGATAKVALGIINPGYRTALVSNPATGGGPVVLDSAVEVFGGLSIDYPGNTEWTDLKAYFFVMLNPPKPGTPIKSIALACSQNMTATLFLLSIGRINIDGTTWWRSLSGSASVIISSVGVAVATLPSTYIIPDSAGSPLAVCIMNNTGGQSGAGGLLHTVKNPFNPAVTTYGMPLPARGIAAEGSAVIPASKTVANCDKYVHAPPWMALLDDSYDNARTAWVSSI